MVVLFQWWIIHAHTILIVGQLILSFVITGVLWQFRNHSRSNRYLFFFFIANTIAILFHWLTSAALTINWYYQTDALTLFFYLLGAIALYYFGHNYDTGSVSQYSKKLHHVLPATLLIIGVIAAFAYVHLNDHICLMILLFMTLIGYIASECVFYSIISKKKKNSSNLSDEKASELRGYMRIILLFIFPFLMSAIYWMFLYQFYPSTVHYFSINIAFILFMFSFVHHFLKYSSKPASLMIKMTMGTLTMVIIVAATMGYINSILHDRDLNQEWIGKVETIEDYVDSNETDKLIDPSRLNHSVSFILSSSLTSESFNDRVDVPYGSLSDRGPIEILMLREETLIPEDLIVDEFVTSHYTKFWSYAGPDPEDTYVLYTFEAGQKLYVVGFSGIHMRDAINARGLPAIFMMLLSSVLVLLVFPWFFRSILVKPLYNLVEGMEKVNEGNLDIHVPKTTEDEFGFLTTSFNQMIISLKKADQYMKNSNEILKDKVKERTSDLRKALEESHSLQKCLFSERELLKQTLRSIGDGLITTDKESNIVMINPPAERMTGWKRSDAVGKALERVFVQQSPKTQEELKNPAEQVMKTGEMYRTHAHTLLISKSGEAIPIEKNVAPIMDEKGKTNGVVLVFRDYTEKKKEEEKIRYLSYYDQLTGIPNRRYFEEELIKVNTSHNLPITLVMLDLNGLKLINDALGHKEGDLALLKAGQIIRDTCYGEMIAARIGGDEFALILPGVEKKEAEKIVNEIQQRIAAEKIRFLKLSASIGWATRSDEKESMDAVFKLAEDRMYQQKLIDSKRMHRHTIDLLLETLYNNHPFEKKCAEKIAILSKKIAISLELDQETVKAIHQAAFMHDLGKIALDPEAMAINASTISEEKKIQERHPEIGYQILRSTQEYLVVADYVLGHHEHWDGTGYPRKQSGNEIPLGSRVIAVAEAWVHLMNPTSTGHPYSHREAIDVLKQMAGKRLDPQLTKTFLEKVLDE